MVLRYVLGFSTDTVARIMGVTEATVRSHCHFARRKVARELGIAFETDYDDEERDMTPRSQCPHRRTRAAGSRHRPGVHRRLRIEREVADTWWRSALLLESSAQRVKPWLPEDAPRHRTPLCTAQHDRPHRICGSCPPW
ncbi:sigma factor-like helix-turn-helix DNA-binding protein [Streptomyces antimycoticus]|uniref:sigma factor-like helix-turn-helix DNA-binding protein n=1 Tax=Streptomyces antimycoticus TaxID=68175 RepID=UPI0034296C4A